jgi:hypothetical protein
VLTQNKVNIDTYKDSYHNKRDKRKYPVKRRSYCESVGDAGQRTVKEALKMLGCQVTMAKSVHANNVDIIFYRDGKIGALEVFNEDANRSYISTKRASGMRRNLRGFKYKGVVCNEGLTKSSETRRIIKNIPFLKLGFQILPRRFYDFFNKRRELFHRKIDSRNTLKHVKNALEGFLVKIGFTLPMYISNVNLVSNVDFVGNITLCNLDLCDVDNLTLRNSNLSYVGKFVNCVRLCFGGMLAELKRRVCRFLDVRRLTVHRVKSRKAYIIYYSLREPYKQKKLGDGK